MDEDWENQYPGWIPDDLGRLPIHYIQNISQVEQQPTQLHIIPTTDTKLTIYFNKTYKLIMRLYEKIFEDGIDEDEMNTMQTKIKHLLQILEDDLLYTEWNEASQLQYTTEQKDSMEYKLDIIQHHLNNLKTKGTLF